MSLQLCETVNERTDLAIFRYFDIKRVSDSAQHKHSRGESVLLFFSVYLRSQKQQSSPAEHIYLCVSIHPQFFVCNTTGALKACTEKHDQMNTEPLISQQRENMFSNRDGCF